MPIGDSALCRRPAFERIESRLLLAVEALVEAAPDVEPPVLSLPGSIAGRVYAVSAVGDAAPGGGPGISGVRLELLSDAGDVLAKAITDESGDYEFPALEPGAYAVRQTQPAGMQDAAAIVGSGGGTAMTPNLVTEIVVAPGAWLEGYHFIELLEPIVTDYPAPTELAPAPFVPPVSVFWSRPRAPMAEPTVWSNLEIFLPASPVELRSPDPIFGGSSGVIEEESVNEAFSDAEFVERIAKAPPIEEESETSEQMAMKRREARLRDQAFEFDADRVDDGADPVEAPAAEAPPSAATHRADARQPHAVRKPAA